jgi:predicted ATPase
VARLVPRLRQLCPDVPPPLDLPAEQERRHLFNSVWEVMARTGRAQPAIFVLDDLQWADEPTMLLVQHMAERVADVPVLIVGLYRDTELDAGRPLPRTLETLIRRRLVRRITLKRLPEEGVAQMLCGLTGQEPPPELVEVLYAETEGNPFFTEEVFKHLAEEAASSTATAASGPICLSRSWTCPRACASSSGTVCGGSVRTGPRSWAALPC